jgi:hypothetical protein
MVPGEQMAAKPKTSAARKTVKKKGATRAASGKEAVKIIDAYLRTKNPQLKDLANELRRAVRKTVPASREGINSWGIPTFDFHGPFGLLMVGKNHVTFGFTRGTTLSDPAGLLEGTGKNLRHVKLQTAEQLRDANLRQLILEAAALNRETPMTPSMRVKKTT